MLTKYVDIYLIGYLCRYKMNIYLMGWVVISRTRLITLSFLFLSTGGEIYIYYKMYIIISFKHIVKLNLFPKKIQKYYKCFI